MNISIIATVFLFLPAPAWAAPIMDVDPLVNMIGMGTVAIIVIMIVKGMLTSRSFKGWLGEFLVRRIATPQLDEDTYRQFNDVTLPTADGTTQNVIRSGRLGRYVLSRNTPLLTKDEVQRILLKINEAMLERSAETKKQHILNLTRKHGPKEPGRSILPSRKAKSRPRSF
jgi:hypothetical protein